jgi:type IX secretion system PorP/SprF family membrane protein
MAKKYLLTFIFSIIGAIAFGQNLPQFTQYIFNQFYFNPGAAGQFNRVQVQSTVRSQYLGYTGNQGPGGDMLSTAFSIDMPVAKLSGGVGLHFASQNISNAQNVGELVLSYSFHKRINSSIVGFGVGAGMNSLTLSGEDFVIRDPDDPFIPGVKMNAMTPQVNAGIYIVNPSYQIGLSAKNILESSYTIGNTEGAFAQTRQYYLTGKYDLGVSYTLDISPMFLVRSDLATTTAELGLMATYNQKFWVGANYRIQDAGSAMLGANVLNNKLKIGYAIDVVTTGVKAKSNTSHELFLRYALSPLKVGKKSIVKTPRYSIQ